MTTQFPAICVETFFYIKKQSIVSEPNIQRLLTETLWVSL